MKALVFLMLLGLVGCGQQYEYAFAFDGPPEDFAAAQKAADEWNGCQTVHVTVASTPDPSKLAIRFQGDEIPGSVYGAAECGHTYADGSIDYTRCGDAIPVASILAHEMGHAMGLDHAGTGVMRAHRYSGDVTVNGDDCNLLDTRKP